MEYILPARERIKMAESREKGEEKIAGEGRTGERKKKKRVSEERGAGKEAGKESERRAVKEGEGREEVEDAMERERKEGGKRAVAPAASERGESGEREEKKGVAAAEEAKGKAEETVKEEGEEERLKIEEKAEGGAGRPGRGEKEAEVGSEEVEIEEEEGEEKEKEGEGKEKRPEEKRVHQAKQKPKIDERVRRLLELRARLKRRKPRFIRQEAYNYARLGEKWRRPRGTHSKMRHHMGYRINVVSIGYGGPAGSRGLHPSGFREVLVHNPRELDRVVPETEAVRIAHSVGKNKRMMIMRRASRMGIRVLNPPKMR